MPLHTTPGRLRQGRAPIVAYAARAEEARRLATTSL